MKRLFALLCIVSVMLMGCSGGDGDADATPTPSKGQKYVAEEIAVLPDEELVEEGNLVTTDLQTNQQGEPALYSMKSEVDENGEEYIALVEYSLNSESVWQTREFCKKALLERYRKETEHSLDIVKVVRGDDGNLYALMKISDPSTGYEKDAEKPYCAYSVLVIDEANNRFQEVKLQTAVTNEQGEEVDYAKEYDVIDFHVRENGTFFLVYSCSSAMWFDGTSGMQTSFCETIADSAFSKNVGYGESEIVYYSSSDKLFHVLDSDSLTVMSEFGKEIPEDNRGYDWFFDVDTSEWQMYAFNQSGLYRISEFGKKASASIISAPGNFDALADANIYDVIVDNKQQVYVLLRRPSEDSESYEESWEYGIVKYTIQK